MNAYLDLMRVRQWYKNLLVFLPLLFVGKLFDIPSLLLTIAGFLSLCFISSTNYIINDILDLKKDQAHPEKKFRPLPSKRVSKNTAIAMASGSFVVSIAIALMFSTFFLFTVLAIAACTLTYSLGLKNEPFLDVLMISLNFVLRAVSGTFIINIAISPWLILCPFFLALFLAVGKRHSDVLLLKEKAHAHKPVLQYYTPEITSTLLIITATATILCYALYAFMSNNGKLIFTFPIAIYVILRYMFHVYSGSSVGRNLEQAIRDWRLMTAGIIWAVLTVIILYFL